MLARSVKLLRRATSHSVVRAFSLNTVNLIAAHAPTQEQGYLKTVRLAGSSPQVQKDFESMDM